VASVVATFSGSSTWRSERHAGRRHRVVRPLPLGMQDSARRTRTRTHPELKLEILGLEARRDVPQLVLAVAPAPHAQRAAAATSRQCARAAHASRTHPRQILCICPDRCSQYSLTSAVPARAHACCGTRLRARRVRTGVLVDDRHGGCRAALVSSLF
jgi:hypothetical protein